MPAQNANNAVVIVLRFRQRNATAGFNNFVKSNVDSENIILLKKNPRTRYRQKDDGPRVGTARASARVLCRKQR